MDGHGIDEVQLFAALPFGDDDVRILQNGEMLGHRLPRHRQSLTQFTQGLSVLVVQPVQKLTAARVCQRPKHRIHAHKRNMQPFGCMSRAELWTCL